MEYLWILWFLLVPMVWEYIVAVLGMGRFIRYCDHHSDIHMIFQITSKWTPKDVVDKSVESILIALKGAPLTNYQIWVVTESIDYNHPAAKVVHVPNGFTANCTYKARALEYARRERAKLGLNSRDIWIYYMDEENNITSQTIKALTDYIHKEGGNKPVASGPIFYHKTLSHLSWLCDAIRPLGSCLGAFYANRFGWFYLQGENTLVRSDIEYRVGWEFGHTLTEDLYNGVYIKRKTGAKFGWHGGIMWSYSPESVKDLWKQRRRWFLGWLRASFNRRIPPLMRIHMRYRLLTWMMGWLSFPVVLVGLVIGFNIPIWATVLLAPSALLFPIAYIIGSWINGRNLKVSFVAVLFIPVLGFIETFSAILALAKPINSFEIIKKEGRPFLP